MLRKVPRQLIVLNVAAGAILLVGVVGVRSILGAIDAGKLKRSLADVRSLVTAIEEYRNDHGSYPVAFRPDQFRAALEPKYMRITPTSSISYYSDGANYALILRPMTDDDPPGATPRDYLGVIEVRNGQFVAWPDLLEEASIRSAEFEFRRLHEQSATESRQDGS